MHVNIIRKIKKVIDNYKYNKKEYNDVLLNYYLIPLYSFNIASKFSKLIEVPDLWADKYYNKLEEFNIFYNRNNIKKNIDKVKVLKIALKELKSCKITHRVNSRHLVLNEFPLYLEKLYNTKPNLSIKYLLCPKTEK
jgi:hypothetical protein